MMTEWYDIVLFAKFSFHLTVLRPVSEALTRLGVKHLLTTKRHIVYDTHNEHQKKFKIMVIADEWVSLFRDCAERVITTGHSLVSKNTTFNQRNQEADWICAASKWQANEFIRRGVTPKEGFWITGYPAADKLFRRDFSNTSEWARVNFDNGRSKVLFCPTYNRALNLVDEIYRISDNGAFWNLVTGHDVGFKVHPVLPKKYPEQMNILRELACQSSHVYCSEDSHGDITDAILWSNISVGDCSGAIILSAIVNPVIAYNNPERTTSEYFDAEGPEWKYRDQFAYEADFLGDLRERVDYLLFEDPKRKDREEFVSLMFGEYTDGRAADRIAMNIQKLLEGKSHV